MLYLKKYFTEGLIQVAILLSLCGVRVDVGLESYLSPAWHQIMMGPTSALTQTQFHNLRNRQGGDGHNLHPKNVDLDGFFTTRRLLGFVHSLDRLQVPQAELETWLVQRDPEPLPLGLADQRNPLEREPARAERDRPAPRTRTGIFDLMQEEEEEEEEEEDGGLTVLHPNGALNGRGEEELGEHPAWMQRFHRRTQGQGTPGRLSGRANAELTQNEVDQTTSSLQECLRLLEETFPFTEEQELGDNDGGRDTEYQPPNREPFPLPMINAQDSSLDLDLHWQDLLDIMEPENSEVDMMTSSGDTWNSQATASHQGLRPEDLRQNNNIMEHGFLGPANLEPTLLPLTPSAELDEQSSVLNNSNMNPLHTLPDHTNLLTSDPSEDYRLRLHPEDTFNINLTQDPVVTMADMDPDSLSNFDVNFHSRDLRPSSFTRTLQGNGMTPDLLASVFLDDDNEDIEGEDGLHRPLGDLLEDTAILDEIRLLDMALDEGFSPEMAARLEEEGFLNPARGQQEGMVVSEDLAQSRRQQEDDKNGADSDSGLSLDSHSPASPSASEASYYSSSSSSSSSLGSPLSEDEVEDAEQGVVASEMDVEVTIKQEPEEEDLGAVGGGYPEDIKKFFPSNYGDQKMFNGFPWLENIGHDHTYNQPMSSASSPSLGKMPTKHSKSSPRHNSVKPYRHISESKMWGRDERRAKALKVPFSNELIVHMPVEEFNDLLAKHQLNEEQLILIRDIRRRGKNKIAAQNCRKRKLDVLLELKDDVSGLKRYRSRLLREKQEALKKLQEIRRQLGTLYQDVFSRLTDEEGRPLDSLEYLLHFEPNGSVRVASRQQGAVKPVTKNTKKPRDKKK